jgi:hypothetical protein
VLEVQECLPSMPKNIDGRPHGRRCRRSESAHHQCKKTLTVGPLGGGVGGLVAPAINAKNIDGGSRGRRCQRSVSAHQATQRRRWRAPWEAVSEVSELPPLISETSMVGPWAPLGVQTLSVVQACVVTCIGSIDKSSSADGSHSPCA